MVFDDGIDVFSYIVKVAYTIEFGSERALIPQ